MKKKRSNAETIFMLIIFLGFIILSITTIVVAIIQFVYHTKHPELTMMQMWQYTWLKYKLLIILDVVDYICLGVYSNHIR